MKIDKSTKYQEQKYKDSDGRWKSAKRLEEPYWERFGSSGLSYDDYRKIKFLSTIDRTRARNKVSRIWSNLGHPNWTDEEWEERIAQKIDVNSYNENMDKLTDFLREKGLSPRNDQTRRL